jgi:hypothetical protein
MRINYLLLFIKTFWNIFNINIDLIFNHLEYVTLVNLVFLLLKLIFPFLIFQSNTIK